MRSRFLMVLLASVLSAQALAERSVGEVLAEIQAAQAAGDRARAEALTREFRAMAGQRRGEMANTLEEAKRNPRTQSMQQDYQRLGQQLQGRGESLEFRIGMAARKGDLAAVKALHAQGARINDYSLDPAPPLFEAIDQKHPQIVTWLLENGAQLRVAGGATTLDALNHAVLRAEDNSEMIRLLVARGAPLDQSAATIASEAVARDRDDGSNPHNIGSSQFARGSALWTAIDQRKYRHARTLLELGASPDIFGNGFTPLMQASRRLDVEAVQLLLEFGADVNVEGPHHITALSEATRVAETAHNRAQVIQLLRDAGAE